jgi:uncharacterized membrane protein YhhN
MKRSELATVCPYGFRFSWFDIGFLVTSGLYLGMTWLVTSSENQVIPPNEDSPLYVLMASIIMEDFVYHACAQVLPLIFLALGTLQSRVFPVLLSNRAMATRGAVRNPKILLVGLCLTAALIASMAGDVFTLHAFHTTTPSLSSPSFLRGTAAFIIAHIFYLIAYFPMSDERTRLVGSWRGVLKAAILFPTFFMIFYHFVWPQLGTQSRIPIIAYVSILSLLTWVTSLRIEALPVSIPLLLPFVGCLFFLYSDLILMCSLLGVKNIQMNNVTMTLILTTYYIAQFLLQRSSFSPIYGVATSLMPGPAALPTPRKSTPKKAIPSTPKTPKTPRSPVSTRSKTPRRKKQE